MIKKKKNRFFLFILLCLHCNTLPGITSWSNPETISSAIFDASDPQVIIDTQGNSTAVWIENNELEASVHPLNGSWSASETLSNLSGTALSPMLGIDSGGNVTAIWLENGVVYSSMLTFGGSWSSAVSISNLLGGASSPVLSVDAAGNAVAVWVRSGIIESSTRTSGVWNSAGAVSGANSDHPQIAISANGTVIAVWHRVITGFDVIQSATKSISGTWNTPKSVFNGVPALMHDYPNVVIDANGNATVAWFRYNISSGAYQNVSVVSSALYFNALTWTVPVFLSKPGLRNPQDLMLKMAVDLNGNVIAYWMNSYNGVSFYLEFSVKSTEASWIRARKPRGLNLYSLAIDIAMNSIGDILATYMFWDGNLLTIQAQEVSISSPFYIWRNLEIISEGSENGYPRCAFSFDGTNSNAAVVWINDNGTNNVIQASVGSAAVVSPPTNLQVIQNSTNLGVYNEFYNTISWQSSPSPNIQQYNIYRNGQYLKAVGPGTLQFIDHNVAQNGAVTYGVATMDPDFSQSEIATISFP